MSKSADVGRWFSYRKARRERPIIGDRRPPSKLGGIQPAHWLAEYTTEILNVLNVIGRLIELEPAQADLLERVCSGQIISTDELRSADAFATPATFNRKKAAKGRQSKQAFSISSKSLLHNCHVIVPQGIQRGRWCGKF